MISDCILLSIRKGSEIFTWESPPQTNANLMLYNMHHMLSLCAWQAWQWPLNMALCLSITLARNDLKPFLHFYLLNAMYIFLFATFVVGFDTMMNFSDRYKCNSIVMNLVSVLQMAVTSYLNWEQAMKRHVPWIGYVYFLIR